MVRPIDFDFNEQTAKDNHFQNQPDGEDNRSVNEKAMEEFEICVEELRAEGVEVIILDEIHAQSRIKTPDAVFCNNWFSTHNTGLMLTYPLATQNRREEVKKTEIVRDLFEKNGFAVIDVVKVVDNITEGEYLESTGSMVIDHLNATVYAALSARTNEKVLQKFLEATDGQYTELVTFDTLSSHGQPFYHTNVMMSIGAQFAVLCAEAIVEKDRQRVIDKLNSTGREVILITLDQAETYFCGNILQLKSRETGNFIIAMSESCLRGFTKEQRDQLRAFGKVVSFPVSKTIEFIGGGSARCMLGEIFLPRPNASRRYSHDLRVFPLPELPEQQ
ncbi:ykgA [Acrasis kona]|uniref:YkgA n=1 Tax=Acrasis kona TaxID=1008807 RepID=A0AAW2Z6Q3_9EUKA